MASLTKQKRVDELLDQAVVSLKRGAHFEAERMANKAMLLAQQAEDFDRMALSVAPLLKARQGRRECALAVGTVTVVEEPVTENTTFLPGCYLVEPPQVGADARRLRMAALQSEVPMLVVCREPLTQLGLWPLVAIGPGATVRTKVQPPDDPTAPDLEWFVNAMEAIGDEAMECVDSQADVLKRIRVILEQLDTVPDHDGLHRLLEELCSEAHRESSTTNGKSTPKSKART